MPTLPLRPPEWIDSAPTVATSQIEIAAGPDAVWARIADHASWPEWFTDLKKVEVIGEGEGVGGGRRVFISRISIDEEFTAWDVQEHFAFAVISSPVPVLAGLAESVRIEATDVGCTVTYRQGLEGRRGCGWLVKQVGKRLQKQTGAALTNLKTVVENG